MRRVIVRSRATLDIREARAWYRTISRTLADDFIAAVDAAIALAAERPLAFQVSHREFRRVLLHRFPYALFYYAAADAIIIVALLHQARDPETLRSR